MYFWGVIDFELEKKWREVVALVSADHGEDLNIEAILFLIGVQELGKGHGKFTKDQKIDLMHVAICRVLEPYGYYRFDGKDEDGWPHYESIKKLPPLDEKQQQYLMKQAIIEYFTEP